MQSSSHPLDGQTSKLRVLVVDNDPEFRDLQRALLTGWGYESFIAEGSGEALLQDARDRAFRHRCHIALVDMHLKDDYDPRDWSGLELTRELRPTVSIIVSGSDDRRAAVAALTEFGVFSFVGKEDHPDLLRRTLVDVAREIATPPYRPQIIWSDGLTSADIVRLLFRDQPDVPGDEVDDVIGRVFHEHQRIALIPLEDTQYSVKPLSALRQRSRLFLVRVDTQRARRVVKLGHRNKIERELQNYQHYVKDDLPTRMRPEQSGNYVLWDLGAVVYSYTGNFSLGTTQTFKTFYCTTDAVERIVQPLQNFFDRHNWGSWYDHKREPLAVSLFDAYDAIWDNHLTQNLTIWAGGDQLLSFPNLGVDLPNPTYWLVQHRHECDLLGEMLKTVTHGDLHGDNLFVEDELALPVDFERTGPGPMLRDIATLSLDILTRLADINLNQISVFYEVAVAICRANRPDSLMWSTETIEYHPEARKALQVVQELHTLSVNLVRYEDQREYLWNLLFHLAFIVIVTPEENSRRLRALLLASIICVRLEQWKQSEWPPAHWLQVTWWTEEARTYRKARVAEINRLKENLEAQLRTSQQGDLDDLRERYDAVVQQLREYGENI